MLSSTDSLAAVRAQARAQFPALASDFAFFENAGGSQVPTSVIEAIHSFLLESYAQTGASYPASLQASAVNAEAHAFVNDLFGGAGRGKVAFAQSASSHFQTLAQSIRPTLRPGDEIVIAVANHESNVGPFVRLQELGVKIRWWEVHPETGVYGPDGLVPLLSDRTRLICYPRTSNLLGDVQDCAAVSRLARGVGAWTVVDAVASAAHEPLSVVEWDVDFCAFSHYKVYGPHVGAMWIRNECLEKIDGPNHFFNLPGEWANRFELGCLPYELLAGILGLREYLRTLAPEASSDRERVTQSFKSMHALEQPLTEHMLAWLKIRDDLRIIGPTSPSERHPTISFVHNRLSSEAIATALCDRGFGVKYGHMYAYRLCEALGLDLVQGVVRISAVHTNTPDEVERLLKALGSILEGAVQ